MGWTEASVITDVDPEERVCFVLCATVHGTAANKAINRASLGHRAREGLHETDNVRVLPIALLAKGAKIV